MVDEGCGPRLLRCYTTRASFGSELATRHICALTETVYWYILGVRAPLTLVEVYRGGGI
jgi:hypothetical protein